MNATLKYTIGTLALCAISWLLTIGILSAIYYEPVVEIDTTGWSAEQIELLERWME